MTSFLVVGSEFWVLVAEVEGIKSTMLVADSELLVTKPS